ncbi:MAG: hypothetical protein AAFQ98_23655 [Bacteroidota bacterium]
MEMTDAEFDVLNVLYFVTPFQEVVAESGLSIESVRDTLGGLLNRGWVRCYEGPGKELMPDEVDFPEDFGRYHYLATKAGLLAHNGR